VEKYLANQTRNRWKSNFPNVWFYLLRKYEEESVNRSQMEVKQL
jgi:hypothetical protein